jgi:pimeloyl-ACP methyl ester carboxylesterase
MSLPGIDLLAAPRGASDLVLLAHGGTVDSLAAAGGWRAPILRMWPFALAARSAAPSAAIGLMRYRYRGWNGAKAHPARDLETVLDGLASSIRRVVLIGHSMGGRAVVAAGKHRLVGGVLGLAPWLPAGEPLVALRGPVVLAHGTLDRITSPALTAAYARRLRAAGIPVALVEVEGDKHAMLHRFADWNELVRRFVALSLGSLGSAGSAGPPVDFPALTTADQTEPLPLWNPIGGPAAGVRDVAAARLRLRILGPPSRGGLVADS